MSKIEEEEYELILALQKGNSAAFDPLFEKYKHRAVRTAYLITGNSSICEDIAQEAFINCYSNIGKLRNPLGFRSWFYKILTRVAWRYGKAAGWEIPTENILDKADKKSTNNSFEQYLQSETNRLLYAEIAQLRPKLKTVVVLYYFSGLTTKEVATAVGCLEGTVKSRLHTARQKLRKSMELQGNYFKEAENHEECRFVF